jgi:hypothetical protein
MSFPTITVYGESDNEYRIRLYSDEDPVNLDDIRKIAIELNNNVELDSYKYPSMFHLYRNIKGVLGLRLGLIWWPTNIYYGKLVMYDDIHSRGIYWGTMRLRTMENTTSIT